MIRAARGALGVGLLIVASASGCDQRPRLGADELPVGEASVLLTDDAGRTVTFGRPPARIVSLVPSATDIIVALGHVSRLVGRTDYDLLPEVDHLPSVGGGLSPSMELLVAVRPDVVVRFRAESDPDTPRQLDLAGIPHVAVRPDRIDDVRRIVRILGTMLEEGLRADSLVAQMDSDLEAVSAEVQALPRPRAVLIGGEPPTVAGPATFLHELLEVAGGDNVFSDIGELYAPMSLEEILRRDVDLIIAPASTPIPPALSSIEARTIPLEVLNPGLRVARSARLLARVLHPNLPP